MINNQNLHLVLKIIEKNLKKKSNSGNENSLIMISYFSLFFFLIQIVLIIL